MAIRQHLKKQNIEKLIATDHVILAKRYADACKCLIEKVEENKSERHDRLEAVEKCEELEEKIKILERKIELRGIKPKAITFCEYVCSDECRRMHEGSDDNWDCVDCAGDAERTCRESVLSFSVTDDKCSIGTLNFVNKNYEEETRYVAWAMCDDKYIFKPKE